MISKLKHLWQNHKILVLAFLLVSAVTLYFLSRAILGAIYFRNHPDLPIEPWMPLGFIAKTYHVPPEVLLDAAGIPVGRSIRKRLWRIAEETDVPYDVLVERLLVAIDQHRVEHPPR